MKKYGKSSSSADGINITSLIDVVFMLVIFFMIGSSFDKTSIPVSLPESSSSVETEGESLIITVDAEANVYVKDVLTAREQLQETIQSLLPELEEEKNAVLYCDETVSLKDIVEVIDLVNSAGIENVAIKTKS